MTLTLDQRKERYYKLVLEKASTLHSSWVTNSITSKKLVEKANEYAFSTKIKTDANYRFKACVFIVALGIRIKKRYNTFFRRLFRIFSYFREKNALKMLKRILGYKSDTDVREMLEMEIDKIAVLLSSRNNDGTSGGGKRIGKDDLTLDEEIELFFEECEKEDEKTLSEAKIKPDKISKSDVVKENSLEKQDELNREKISVKEFEKEEKSADVKKEGETKTKITQTEKETVVTENDVTEKAKIEKPETKSVAETSVLAETMVLGQDKEDIPSPFPVFRDNVDNNVTLKGNEKGALETVKNEIKVEVKNAENLNADLKNDFDKEKNPFPVFNKGDGGTVVKAPDKPIEKEIKSSQESREVNDFKEFKNSEKLNFSVEENKNPGLEVSMENQVRRELIFNMSEEQFGAMIDMIKESAKVEMERVEQEWREQISVAQDTGDVKTNVKPIESAPKNENIVTIPKK